MPLRHDKQSLLRAGDKLSQRTSRARLSALGWVDVWRHFHGDVTEYTWYSLPKGGAPASGFRLDHAFATPSLLPRITACRYSHAERERKVSDHSPMILEFK